MVQAPTRWTAEMVRALPEDRNRYEVIAGDLVVNPGPSWTHQVALTRLARRLLAHLDSQRIGLLLCAPADIEFSNDTLVLPDIFIVPLDAGRAPRRWEDVRRLLLVIEVLSPSSARTDRVHKRELYLAQGAPKYWIVDVDARLIERWRPHDPRPDITTDAIVWQPENAPEPFVLNLADFFGEVLDR
jgi:Uma2 family endonuclease